jgi:hypothetical protein
MGLIMNSDAANETGIVTALSEQLRLAREELQRLRDRLADAELGLATFQQQVATFKRQYHDVTSVLREELDRLDRLTIAELMEAQGNKEAAAAAREEPGERPKQRSRPSDQSEPPRFSPSPSLQKRFREAAKRFHPDLADDDEDAAWRTQMMQKINAAFAAGDEDVIDRLLSQEREVVEFAAQPDPELMALQTKIARSRARLEEVVRQQRALATSEMGQLFLQAEASGQDTAVFLQMVADTLKAEVKQRERRLKDLIAARKGRE